MKVYEAVAETLVAEGWDDVLWLAWEANLGLLARPETLDRMRHMLATGKALRN